MILQTGGCAFGEITTKSNPAMRANSLPRSGDTTPTFSPSAPISLISGDVTR